MQEIKSGETQSVTIEPGYTLIASSSSAGISAISGRVRPKDARTLTDPSFTNILANSSKLFGPFPTVRTYLLDAVGVGDTLFYEIVKQPFDFATQAGNIEDFVGNFTLKNEDMGKIFRCDDTANVTVTVPNTLRKGFNCGFAMWNTGTITISVANGATNRSDKTGLSSQYQIGSLMVIKQDSTNDAPEFTLGGDFA